MVLARTGPVHTVSNIMFFYTSFLDFLQGVFCENITENTLVSLF